MKLPASRWQQAWHDEDLAGKFVKDLDKLEKGTVQTLDSSAKWLDQLLVELGQLAQNMIQLEEEAPHPPQLQLSLERALKLGALSVHLAGALHQAHADLTRPAEGEHPDPSRPGMAAAVEAATQQAEAIGMPPVTDPEAPAPIPMRRAIQSLADRGVSLGELELITGYPKHIIQVILSEP